MKKIRKTLLLPSSLPACSQPQNSNRPCWRITIMTKNQKKVKTNKYPNSRNKEREKSSSRLNSKTQMAASLKLTRLICSEVGCRNKSIRQYSKPKCYSKKLNSAKTPSMPIAICTRSLSKTFTWSRSVMVPQNTKSLLTKEFSRY